MESNYTFKLYQTVLVVVVDFSMARMHEKAGTKVGPDQLGPPVRVRSTWIDSDQLGSNKKIKIK